MQEQPSRGALIKRDSGNMQQIYRRTSMSKFDFNKVCFATFLKSYTSAWVFSCKFAEYFRNNFSYEHI